MNAAGRPGTSRLRRVAFLLVLPALLAGCSGYRTAVVPRPGDSSAGAVAADGAADAPVVKPGTRVRVRLRDGRTHEGQVTAVTDEALVLGRPGNYGLAEEAIPHGAIERVEVAASGPVSEFAAGAVGGVLVAVVALGVLAALFLDIGPAGPS